MKSHLHELLWQLETDVGIFVYSEFKVFRSKAEAKRYGRRREIELNGGVSIEERAQDGYCFKYHGANKLREINGFIVNLDRRKSLNGDCFAFGSQ